MRTAGLSDLFTELWLRNRNNGNLIWRTRDGKEIPIKDMTDEHLLNTINMLEKIKEVQDNADYDCLLND